MRSTPGMDYSISEEMARRGSHAGMTIWLRSPEQIDIIVFRTKWVTLAKIEKTAPSNASIFTLYHSLNDEGKASSSSSSTALTWSVHHVACQLSTEKNSYVVNENPKTWTVPSNFEGNAIKSRQLSTAANQNQRRFQKSRS